MKQPPAKYLGDVELEGLAVGEGVHALAQGSPESTPPGEEHPQLSSRTNLETVLPPPVPRGIHGDEPPHELGLLPLGSHGKLVYHDILNA
jgi:hypothetical protein